MNNFNLLQNLRFLATALPIELLSSTKISNISVTTFRASVSFEQILCHHNLPFLG